MLGSTAIASALLWGISSPEDLTILRSGSSLARGSNGHCRERFDVAKVIGFNDSRQGAAAINEQKKSDENRRIKRIYE